jgi:hypothetical protein
MKKISLVIFILLLCGNSLADESSQNSNFTIAPAPIPNPFFEAGRLDSKLTGVYLSMKSDIVDLTGVAGGYNLRESGSDHLAFDGMFTLFGMSGAMKLSGYDDIKMKIMGWHIQGDLEFQVIKKDDFSMILFAGGAWDFLVMSYTNVPTYSLPPNNNIEYDLLPRNIIANTVAIPFGVQSGINLKGVTLVPYAQILQVLGGAMTMGYKRAPMGAQTAASIGSSQSMVIGMDILIDKYDISIGSMLQKAQDSSSGSSDSVDTVMFTLSWGGTKYDKEKQPDKQNTGIHALFDDKNKEAEEIQPSIVEKPKEENELEIKSEPEKK